MGEGDGGAAAVSDRTEIAWTDATWNPVRGCAPVSEGCRNCYAARMAHRFSGPGKPYEGLTRLTDHGPKWTGKVRLVPEVLGQPLRWRKPRRIFVNSMADLFHEEVPDEFIDRVSAVAAFCKQHTFLVLTKRSGRMRSHLAALGKSFTRLNAARPEGYALEWRGIPLVTWPLPNLWVGVTAENQARLDERLPDLLATPAACRFVSLEPLLGPVDLEDYLTPIDPCPGWPLGRPALDLAIVGGESGPGARPCRVEWVRSIVEQCRAARVPVFVKQIQIDGRTSKNLDEWPPDLRVREFPR
jgi:protein gp37